jgi:hypothetical protein
MWPWEHLAVGYLAYSLYARRRYGRPPDGPTAVMLAIGTQLPDLVDKPLAWTFGVLPNGTSLAHSLTFVALFVPITLLVARLAGVPRWGGALAFGHVSHLPGDMLYPLATDGGLATSFLLWPFVPGRDTPSQGLLFEFETYFAEFVQFLGTPRGQIYFALELALLGTALLVWNRDGRPVLTEVLAAGLPRYTSE